MNILIWIISGVVAGWIAGLLVRGRGFGLIGDLIVGLVGGLIGGWLAGLLDPHPCIVRSRCQNDQMIDRSGC